MSRPDEPDHVATSRAVYDHSVDQFLDAIGAFVSSGSETATDRAMLVAFAHDVASESPGPVVDAGCGPGRVTRFLADAGIDVSGVDVSPRMIQAARSAHPGLRFDVASLTSLPRPERSLAGIVYWYSIIATPPEELRAVWAESDRVLSVGGGILLAFQAGDNDVVVRPDAYGSSSTLTLHRHRVDDVIESLDQAGFDVLVDVRRAPVFDHETTPQAILIARRRPG